VASSRAAKARSSCSFNAAFSCECDT
jgi:hypothetical protein